MKKLLFSLLIICLSAIFAVSNSSEIKVKLSERDHKKALSLYDNQNTYLKSYAKRTSEFENICTINKEKSKSPAHLIREKQWATLLMWTSEMCTTPGAPQNVTATATGPNTASLDWAPGNPVGSDIVTYYWVVGTSPTVSYNSGVAQGSTTGLWAGATGLLPGVTYYLRVYAVSSCNNIGSAYSTSSTFVTNGGGNCITPGTPVSLTATGIGPNTASLDWAAGNPAGSLNVIYYWVVGTSPSVTYGYGVEQGSTAGTWAGATGLIPGTTYYLRVFARTSCDNSNSGYGTSYAFTTSGYSGCTTPGTPVSVTATGTGPNTASLDWAPGNPAGSPTVTYFWVVGTSPSVIYGNGVAQGSTTGLWAGATGLSPGTTYYLRVFASTSCNNSNSGYGTSYAFTTSGYSGCTTPGTPVSVIATGTGPNTASLDWAPGNPAGSPTVTYFWVVGTSASVTYGNGVAQGSTTGLWAGATGLSPGTTYYLRVFASTSCDNSNSGYGTSYSFTTSGYGNCITPGTPVSVIATGTGPNTASLDWLAGNPAGSPTVTYYWVVGTSPSVIYGNGVAQGSTTGLWAGATGLSPGTTYYLRVFASTSCNNSNSGYGTSYAFTTSGYSGCTTPGAPISVTATATGSNTASLDWSPGNPAGSPTVTYFWVVGISPSVIYGNGVAQGSTTGLWAGATGLSPGTTYYLRVFASTSCNNTNSGYGTSYAFTTSGYGNCITPGAPVSVTATATGSNTVSLDWASGTPAGSATVTYFWVVGTSPSVIYGNGVAQGSTTGLWAGATGLSPGTTYYLRVFASTSCNNSNSGYGTSYAFTTSGYSGCTTPGTPVSVTATGTGPNTASLDWLAGNPAGSPTVTYFWVVGTSASVTYGNGVAQGSTTGLWAGATGLSPGTTYYLRVFASTSCNNSNSGYGTSYAFTTSVYSGCTTPGAPISVTATATGSNTASLDWSPGNPAGSPTVTYFWVVGTSPSVIYGNGVAQGSTTGLWAGATGLSPGTTYYLRVFASTSCNNSNSGYGTSYAFTTSGYGNCISPGTPGSVTATGTGPNTASLDWAPGNPAGSPTVTYFWVVGTSPSVIYGNGVAQGSTTGLWAGATGLFPGTTYYLRVFASTSCNNSNSGYSTSYSFTTSGYGNCITPGAPVSVTATGTGPNTASLDWSPGNPAGSPTVTYFWVVGTSPSVIYGNGVAQGSTTGLWAGATGLSPGTTYYLRVFASTSCNNTNSGYGTSYAFTTSGYGNCITPGTPGSVTATGTGPNTASLDWAPGTPAGSANVTYYWVVGTSASVTYGNGVAQGSTAGTWAGATGLIPGTTYYLRVYASTSCNNSYSVYGTSYAFTTDCGCTTPGTPISVVATSTGSNSAGLDWASGNPAGTPTVTYYWVVGTSASVTYGNGVTQGSTTDTWASASGLSQGTTYYLRVYASSNCNNSNSSYSTSYAFMTNGYSGCITPGIPISVSATATGPNTASLDWASGNPLGSAVVTYYWVVGTSASVTYGNGIAQGSTTETWANVTGLSSGTSYYLRVYASTSCNNSSSAYSTSNVFTTSGYNGCMTPGTPVSVVATATGPNTASLDWTPGNPVGTPTVTYFWVIGTSSSVTYGNGVAQGSTTGTWAGATGLSPCTNYYLRVFASTSCNNSTSGYGTSIVFTTNGYSGCTTPGTPLSVTATSTGPNTASLDWTTGNPAGSATVTYYWVVGTSPSVIYGNGVAQGSTTGLWAGATGLLPGTTYYLRVFASTSCNNSNSGYGTSYAFTTSGYGICTTPGTPLSVTGTSTGQTTASLDWTAGNPIGSATVTYYWVVGTSPSVIYGNGIAQGITTGLWAGATGLSPGTTYYLRVFARTSCNNTNSGYGTSYAFTTNSGGCVTPVNQTTNITFTYISTQQFTANWVNGNGSRRVVKINTVNSFTPPTNGTDPIANNNYVGYGEQVVYNGNGNSVIISGLSPNTTYWVRIYEANCSGSSSVYNTSPGTNNPVSERTRTVLPSIQSFAASNVILNGTTIVDINPIFFTNQLYAVHPPIDIFIEGNNKTRFTLNASYAEGFSFQLVDQLTIVTDGATAINPPVYGQLSPVISTSVNSMYMDYTHPENVVSPYLSLKIRLLFEGGLVGMSIPVHIHAAQGALPVEWVDFQAEYNKQNDINELTWTTKSEVNNDHFDIERSFEGSGFEKIGKVDGLGNSSASVDYSFIDKHIPLDGNYVYRLKQVDTDGRENYSKPAAVQVSRSKSVKTGIFPNPATDIIHCQVDAYDGAKISIDIFNSLGQKVSPNFIHEEFFANKITRQLDCKDFGKGLYTVVFTIDGIRYNHKLIIIE